MQRILVALAACTAWGGPALADCIDQSSFFGTGLIMTKGGGTYSYGISVGGEAMMGGYLTGRPDGLPDAQFDLAPGYHIAWADAGLARLLSPDAAGAEPDGTRLFVTFFAEGDLPEAQPGTGWKGKVLATVFALADDDYNRRAIGDALLDGSYAFLEEISADFDGCSYRVFPVELTLTYKGETALKRRILYFPDLGVSAITKWGPDADGPERKTGITGFGIAE